MYITEDTELHRNTAASNTSKRKHNTFETEIICTWKRNLQKGAEINESRIRHTLDGPCIAVSISNAKQKKNYIKKEIQKHLLGSSM